MTKVQVLNKCTGFQERWKELPENREIGPTHRRTEGRVGAELEI